MNNKEFGKYTLDQLVGLCEGVGQLRALEYEVLAEFQAKPEKLRSLLTPHFYWAALYERPFLDVLAMLTVASGMSEEVMAMALLPDPQDAALSSVDIESDSSTGVNFSHIFTLLYAVTKSKECLMIYDHHMHDLIAKIRQGSDKALFKAVRIDRSVVASPTVADRITMAEIEEDRSFLKELGKAIAAGPPKQSADYPDLRFMLATLEEEAVLDRLSQADEYQLFVRELRVYPDNDDAPRSLHRFISRWKKSRRST